MQREYTCYTNRGHWTFYAQDSYKDALRVALFYCWRDDEEFIRVEYNNGGEHCTLRVAVIDHKTNESFTL